PNGGEKGLSRRGGWWGGPPMRKIPKKRFLDVAGMILRNKMAKEAIYPFYCSFKLTRRCNFTCSFCNCWHVKNKWVDMPTEDVKAVLDKLARSSVTVFSFDGGDPLVREDILELLKYQYEKQYPGVIISPDGYFNRITWDHGCDTSSIIVDADGFLWYPCRVLEEKTINLIDSDLMTYLESPDARERRQRMAACDIQCAWYQYYATQSFVNPRELLSAWMPYYRDLLNKGKQPVFAASPIAPRD